MVFVVVFRYGHVISHKKLMDNRVGVTGINGQGLALTCNGKH